MIRLHKMNEQGIQSEYYKWLAFIDPLTHGFNRSAFERDSKIYFNNEMKDSWLFILDLNNLKSINDTIGHKSGDDAIKNVFKCLVDSFGHDSYVYRMGGDEFACILPNSCAEAAIERVTYFYELMETKNLSLPYNLSAAIGYSEFIADKWETFDEFFSYVDNLMYENKQIMKKEKSCSK